MMLSKNEPALTCHKSNPMYFKLCINANGSDFGTEFGFLIIGASHGPPEYFGFSIIGCVHGPLYSGFGTIGGSQSPSMSSSQSSGFGCSGSAMFSGMSS